MSEIASGTPLRFVTCDVFTQQRYAGNPLAIVLGADGLSGAQMQTIAREFNLSETIFVMAPADPAHDARVRIFFPTAEIPFAGHPTIGCAIHLALQDAAPGDFSRTIVLEEEAGLVPVLVTREGDALLAEFRAPVLPHAVKACLPGASLLAGCLGLPVEAIGFGTQRPGVWQGGPRFLYVPVRDLAALGQAGPREPQWSQVMDIAGVDSAYLYTPGQDCDFQARMFSPTAGIPEDPATGSATAILAAQLMASGALTGNDSFALYQGVEMGRPSQLRLSVLSQGGTLTEVRVAGSAVPVSEGRITAP